MIQFIGFLPDKREKFTSLIMLLVGSIVEITYYSPYKERMITEAILLTGATDDGLYFSRTLKMQEHSWVLKRVAEKGQFTSNNYAVAWGNIKSIIYIGNYDEANSYLAAQA